MSNIGWVVLEQGADSTQQECGAVPSVALTALMRWNEVSLGSPFDWQGARWGPGQVFGFYTDASDSHYNLSGSAPCRLTGKVGYLIVATCGYISCPVYGIFIFHTLQGFLDQVPFSECEKPTLSLEEITE